MSGCPSPRCRSTLRCSSSLTPRVTLGAAWRHHLPLCQRRRRERAAPAPKPWRPRRAHRRRRRDDPGVPSADRRVLDYARARLFAGSPFDRVDPARLSLEQARHGRIVPGDPPDLHRAETLARVPAACGGAPDGMALGSNRGHSTDILPRAQHSNPHEFRLLGAGGTGIAPATCGFGAQGS